MADAAEPDISERPRPRRPVAASLGEMDLRRVSRDEEEDRGIVVARAEF